MKKMLTSIVCASALLLPNTSVYAAEGTKEIGAGITPDKITYFTDKLVEDIQVSFTYDDEQKADLLIDISQERLAEAKEMAEKEKSQYVETAIDGYLETVADAEEAILDVITDEDISEEIKEELINELEDVSQVDDIVQENLDEDKKEELIEKTEEVSYSANVVANIDVEVVKNLRNQGFGFGKIAYINSLSTISGKSVDELASVVVDDNKGLGELSKELGIKPSEIRSNSKSNVKNTNKENKVDIDKSIETKEVELNKDEVKTTTNDNTVKSNAPKIEKPEIDKEVVKPNKNKEVKKASEQNKEQKDISKIDEKKPLKTNTNKEKEDKKNKDL